MKKVIFTFLLFAFFNSFSQEYNPLYKGGAQLKWVDSLYNSMSLDEKLGQLFMPFIPSDNTVKNRAYIKELLDSLYIGNFFFLKENQQMSNFLIILFSKILNIPL